MDLGARSSPAAAKRCAEGAGLEGAPQSVTSSKRSQIFPTQALLRFFELSFRSDPRRALCVRAAFAAPTYIRPGSTRSKVPHARCEGAGSKGDGTILYRGVFQPCRDPVTSSTLDLISSCYRYLVFVPHPLRTAPRGTRPVSR